MNTRTMNLGNTRKDPRMEEDRQMSYTNAEMEQMVGALSKHLGRVDLIGYAAARNTRVLTDELREYSAFKDELIAKHGETEVDENGEQTGRVSLSPKSPGFVDFLREIDPLAAVEHEPNLFTLPYAEAIGVLSGTELLEIDWMFADE